MKIATRNLTLLIATALLGACDRNVEEPSVPALAATTESRTTDVNVFSPGGEPALVVNPLNDQNFVMGHNVDGVSYSFDGGKTWSHVAVPNMGDNVLTVQPDGTFLFSSLSGEIHASEDGGASWKPVGNWVGAVSQLAYPLLPDVGYPGYNAGGNVVREVACNAPNAAGAGPVDTDVPREGPGPQTIGCDRPWMVTDPHTGKVYLSFSVHQDPSGGTGGSFLPWEVAAVLCLGNVTTPAPAVQCGRQYVAVSEDAGRTWSSFRPFDSAEYPAAVTTAWNSGPIASFGVLATAYIASGADCTPCIIFQTSTDDGLTWERHAVDTAEFPETNDPLCAPLGCGDASLNTSYVFEPYNAADPSQPGRYAVMVFDGSQTQLFVYVTEDWGKTWQRSILAEPGDGVARWLPWIAYGPEGALGVVWVTSYADGSFDTWAAVSPDGNAEFQTPVRLSSERSAGPVATGGNDTSDVILSRDTLYAAWGDNRGQPAPPAWFGSGSNRFGTYRFVSQE